MSVELPKDAEGREIPLDTEHLYMNGVRHNVEVFTFSRKCGEWSVETNIAIYDPADLYLTPPDSWEKLEEDLDRCIEEDSLCPYFSMTGKCSTCIISEHSPDSPCHGDSLALKDIKERIRNLRGVS